MRILCLDLEGVLIPEIWLGVAERTGIEALKLTTRDIQDYDELMRHRLGVLDEHGVTMDDVQAVIATLEPLPGACEFLDRMRGQVQIAILSDTFYEFAAPLMGALGWPMLLCHRLTVDAGGRIADYHIRQPDPKRASVKAFHSLRYQVIAAGDSFNDTSMLDEADAGFFFCAPPNVTELFPQFPATSSHPELAEHVEAVLAEDR